MRRLLSSNQFTLLSFFVMVILAGSFLLSRPAAWSGAGRLAYLDALFTSTSAVCVTGLITVDTAAFSRFGKIVILLLIQIGGLGIMSFATLYLTAPGRRISLVRARIIQDYYVDSVEYRERSIIRNILLFTLATEAVGALVLFIRFSALERGGPALADGALFTAVFHSISAFCNAGFSLFSSNLEAYAKETTILLTIMLLIVAGGIGFVVIQDLLGRLRGRSRTLSLHSRIAIGMTLLLIGAGAAIYYALERRGALAVMELPYRVLNALFQSVTPRTAGFNVLPQARLGAASKAFTLFLMFTGGAPGSIAGGVKVTTMFLVLAVLLRGTSADGSLIIRRRQVEPQTVSRAQIFALRALFLLFVSMLLLCVTELSVPGAPWTFLDVVFESFSAFGTVGLSLGITPALSAAGKLIVIATMFAGRVGLITMAIALPRQKNESVRIEYASEKVLVG
jgi:trk system potassium uptake protein TrkH